MDRLEQGGLVASGVGDDGELRIVELPRPPSFVATLFLPQARSSPSSPHPVLAGYAAAVREVAERRGGRAPEASAHDPRPGAG